VLKVPILLLKVRVSAASFQRAVRKISIRELFKSFIRRPFGGNAPRLIQRRLKRRKIQLHFLPCSLVC
jgi:hypothetical protein